jgi:predicted RND superfamily exporter protein
MRRDAIACTVSAGVMITLFLGLAFRQWTAPLVITIVAGSGVLVAENADL